MSRRRSMPLPPLPVGQILVGDAGQQLRHLPEGSVDMVLTSPPYFRLRDYQVPGQIGLEAHVDQWVDELVVVMAGVRRVLKPTGTLWLNLGDSYSTHARQGAPRKSLLLGPEGLASRMVASGWVLRSKIIWAKANPMPSSVRDRFACAHEYVYVFAKSDRYYFDLDAVRVPHRSSARAEPKPKPTGQPTSRPAREAWRGPNSDNASGLTELHARGIVGHRLGKNPGDVWTIPSSNFRGAHHATFPVALARRAIAAGCPPGGVVLDPFMGAGTTAVAAEQLVRAWVGIELNSEFAAVARRRIQDARPDRDERPEFPEQPHTKRRPA